MSGKFVNPPGSWMYFDPPRPSKKKQLPPPISQIPTIGGHPSDLDPIVYPSRLFESDSPFIRKAKMGGTRNLLAFEPETSGSKQPVQHSPQCDWYYLEDNRALDEARRAEEEKICPKALHKFQVPHYMTHGILGSDSDPNNSNCDKSLHDVTNEKAPPPTKAPTAPFKKERITNMTRRPKKMKRPTFAKPPPLQSIQPPPMLAICEKDTNMHDLIAQGYTKDYHTLREMYENRLNRPKPEKQIVNEQIPPAKPRLP